MKDVLQIALSGFWPVVGGAKDRAAKFSIK